MLVLKFLLFKWILMFKIKINVCGDIFVNILRKIDIFIYDVLVLRFIFSFNVILIYFIMFIIFKMKM